MRARVNAAQLVTSNTDVPETAVGATRDVERGRYRRRDAELFNVVRLFRIEPADLVGKRFGEPDCAVRPDRDSDWATVCSGCLVFGDLSGLRVQSSDLMTILLGEPDRSVSRHRDAHGETIGSRNGEQLDAERVAGRCRGNLRDL